MCFAYNQPGFECIPKHRTTIVPTTIYMAPKQNKQKDKHTDTRKVDGFQVYSKVCWSWSCLGQFFLQLWMVLGSLHGLLACHSKSSGQFSPGQLFFPIVCFSWGNCVATFMLRILFASTRSSFSQIWKENLLEGEFVCVFGASLLIPWLWNQW